MTERHGLIADEWIRRGESGDHRIVPSPEMLHALGTVTFRWNFCENHLSEMFAIIAGLSKELAWIITRDMGDVTICEKIEAAAKISDLDAAEQDALSAILSLYNVNRENRNQLTHFVTIFDVGRGPFARKSKTSFQPQPFPSSLADIRRVADDIMILVVQLLHFDSYLKVRSRTERIPLPEIPPPPEKLWRPPPQARSERKRRPRS